MCLASGLAITHWKHLATVIPRDELDDWYALWQVNPWGPRRIDAAIGALSQRVLGAFNDIDDDDQPDSMFYPYWTEPEVATADDARDGFTMMQQHRYAYGYD